MCKLPTYRDILHEIHALHKSEVSQSLCLRPHNISLHRRDAHEPNFLNPGFPRPSLPTPDLHSFDITLYIFSVISFISFSLTGKSLCFYFYCHQAATVVTALAVPFLAHPAHVHIWLRSAGRSVLACSRHYSQPHPQN